MSRKIEQLAADLAEAWRSGGSTPLPAAELIGGNVAGSLSRPTLADFPQLSLTLV